MSRRKESITQNSRLKRHLEKFNNYNDAQNRYNEIMELQKIKFCYPETLKEIPDGYMLIWAEKL
mgnify:CR=1 FL=1